MTTNAMDKDKESDDVDDNNLVPDVSKDRGAYKGGKRRNPTFPQDQILDIRYQLSNMSIEAGGLQKVPTMLVS